jgi:class 3 adenylate cyclase
MSAATEILVLFMTDVEGSTSLWNDRKQKMLETLDHRDFPASRSVAQGALSSAGHLGYGPAGVL